MRFATFQTAFLLLALGFCATAIAKQNEQPCKAEVTTNSAAKQLPNVSAAAMQALREKRYDDALPEYREAVRLEPDNPIARNILAGILVNTGQIEEGLKESEEAVELETDNPEWRYNCGLFLLKANRIEEGFNEFQAAIQLDPDKHRGYVRIAKYQAYIRRYTDAIESFSAALTVNDSPEVRLDRASALYRNDQNEAAVEDCNIVLQTDPKNHRAYAYRAYANIRRGKSEQAQADAEQALAAGDAFADMAHFVLGLAAAKREDSKVAIEHFNKAISISPNYPQPYVARAFIHLQTSHSDLAVADLDEAIRVAAGPDTLNRHMDGYGWQIYKFRGYINLVYRGRYDAAVADLTQAIELNNGDADCYALRSVAYTSLANWNESLRDSEKASEIFPDHTTGPILLTRILASCPESGIRDGRRAQAIVRRGCKSTRYRNPIYIQELAAAFAETGEFESALLWQSEAADLVGNEGSIHEWKMEVRGIGTYSIHITVTKDDAAERLELYRQKQPYRLPNANVANLRTAESPLAK